VGSRCCRGHYRRGCAPHEHHQLGRRRDPQAARHRRICAGRQALRDNGGRSVFLARFTAFLRAVMPGLAGTARPYRRFLVFNAAGGLVWAAGFTLIGYFAGASYRAVEKIAGWAGYVILAMVALAVIIFVIRRRRRERDPRPPAER
jgi:membrane-associated protein